MQEFDLSNSSDLDMKPDEMDEMEIDELFQMAVGDFNYGHPQSVKTSYFMFKKIVERNPKFKEDDGDNPYYYMGRICEYYFWFAPWAAFSQYSDSPDGEWIGGASRGTDKVEGGSAARRLTGRPPRAAHPAPRQRPRPRTASPPRRLAARARPAGAA